MQKKLQKLTCTLFLALSIAACSGGGGGSDDGSDLTTFNCTIPTNLLPLTVLEGETQTAEIVEVINSFLGTANALGFLIDLAGDAAASGSTSCDASMGTVTITFTDADMSGTVTQGDSIRAVFSDCLSDGAVINGRFEITYTTITGTDPGNKASGTDWSAVLTSQLTALEVEEAGESIRFDGDLTINIVYSFGAATVDATATSTLLELRLNNSECGSIANANINSFLNVGTDAYDVTFTIGQIASTEDIDGVISNINSVGGFNLIGVEVLSADEYFVELDGVMGPNMGRFTLDGDTSNILVRIMDVTMVDIDVDEDANMSPDGTIMTDWGSLVN